MMKKQPSWAVIFDCDGVIVNSEPIGLGTLADVVKHFGLPLARPELDFYCGHSDIATYYDFVAKYGEFATAAEFIKAIDEAYVHAVEQLGMQVFPGVLSLVTQLTDLSVPYGIGSSGAQGKVATSLTAANILDLFPVIVGGDDVSEAKPAPDIFLTVASRLATEPARCVVIEDSPTGVEAAKRAGMPCVAVTTSFPAPVLAQADLIVSSFTELNVQVLRDLAYTTR